jgi:hypothetical protein
MNPEICNILTLEGVNLNLAGIIVQIGVEDPDSADDCMGVCIKAQRGTLLGGLLCGLLGQAEA